MERTVTVTVLASCDCKAGRPLVGGGLPEYFDRGGIAARRFLQLESEKPDDVWAVHLAGRHVIAAEVRDHGSTG